MTKVIPIDEATGVLPVSGSKVKPITVIGTDAIRNTFDERCLEQAINSRLAPGVSHLVLNPDAHAGYGAPVGCVLTSPSHIYPGPVGFPDGIYPSQQVIRSLCTPRSGRVRRTRISMT